MFKKIIGKLVSLCVIASMGYMAYTGDFTYLNAITVYYSVILALYCVTIPIVALCLLLPADHKGSEDVLKMYKEIVKTKQGARGVINCILFVASVPLLIACGYVFIAVAHILATLSFIAVMGSAKKWINKYHEHKEVEALAEFAEMARDDAKEDRTMSSDEFKDKLAKRKQNL